MDWGADCGDSVWVGVEGVFLPVNLSQIDMMNIREMNVDMAGLRCDCDCDCWAWSRDGDDEVARNIFWDKPIAGALTIGAPSHV